MQKNELTRPFAIKSLSLTGRVVMAPMTRSWSPQNIPGPEVARYYRRRAENNVALIITEGTVVDPSGHAYPNVPNFYGKKSLQGWKGVVEKVHEAGGKIFAQLWHAGSVRTAGMPPDPSVSGYGPSSVLHPSIKEGDLPREMSGNDIENMITAFSKAAYQAKRIGFDGIELHGAHGYLIDQFFWERTNHRTDFYGGSTIADRTRFAVDIIQAVRQQVGVDFPICLRFSQWKLGDYEAKLARTPKELETFLTPLVNAGVDIFHCSTRRFFEPEFSGAELNLAGWTKKITTKPVISVGSVGMNTDFISDRISPEADKPQRSKKTIRYLLERLERDEFDLIAIGRSLLADPEWVTKVIDGRFEEITPFTMESLNTLS
ncbi:MAG: 12-oxophytodienoate reductase [Deltaproteobacteria bacterium]|nr:MAG: 12-oxophytodienoate reductase [Deltaproteobacteria bacterium]